MLNTLFKSQEWVEQFTEMSLTSHISRKFTWIIRIKVSIEFLISVIKVLLFTPSYPLYCWLIIICFQDFSSIIFSISVICIFCTDCRNIESQTWKNYTSLNCMLSQTLGFLLICLISAYTSKAFCKSKILICHNLLFKSAGITSFSCIDQSSKGWNYVLGSRRWVIIAWWWSCDPN